MKIAIAIALGLTLASLAGCQKKAETPKTAAGGDLLPRSTNDEMVPYDTLRSQPPLASPGASDYESASTPHAAAADAAQDEEADDAAPAQDDAPVEDVPEAPAAQ